MAPVNRRRVVLISALVAVVAAAGTVLGVTLSGSSTPGESQSLQAFASAWSSGHPENGPLVDSAGVATAYRSATRGLAAAHPPVVTLLPAAKAKGDTSRERFRAVQVRWSLAGDAPFQYDVTLMLTRDKAGPWKVNWSPAAIYPGMQPGDTLIAQATPAQRASITGARGLPLVSPQPVVIVGIEPSRVKNLATLTARLGQLLHIDTADLTERVKASSAHQFVDVITLRRADYEALAAQLQPLPGTVFQTSTLPLAPTRAFARTLLGQVGPVTADLIKAHPGRYAVGQQVGLSGQQAAYQDRLGGTRGLQVALKRVAGSLADDKTLLTVAAKAGQPVHTTIDPVVQEAADNALVGQSRPSALVAIRVSTGDVLAVANGPDGGAYDIGLTAQAPPGSTFKVISTLALLEGGLRPDAPVACEPTVTVGGRTFHNAEHESFGILPFHTDFARSCNTAFVSLAPRLSSAQLSITAKSLGIGVPLDLGAPAFPGSVPVTTGPVDQAASIFGQGRILMSPIAVALSTAAVARGRVATPRLVTDITPKPISSPVLAPGPIASLRILMREVVTSGTAIALASVPGDPGVRQNGHGRARQRPESAQRRLDHRLAGRCGLLRLRTRRGIRRGYGRAHRFALPYRLARQLMPFGCSKRKVTPRAG